MLTASPIRQHQVKNVLVYEHITGGGLAKQDLPESLLKEGQLMLDALIQGLSAIPLINITVLLDWRCHTLVKHGDFERVIVKQHQSVFDLLPTILDQYDYIWPIAPEIDETLFRITKLLEKHQIICLNSGHDSVRQCSDKFQTFQLLSQANVATIDTALLNTYSNTWQDDIVIKHRYGMGCLDSFYISEPGQFDVIVDQLSHKNDYIVQPFVAGDVLSLSCLFNRRDATLICINRQHITQRSGQFCLTACEVNVDYSDLSCFQTMIDRIFNVFKGLWGYVGIDIIATDDHQYYVLEINPRLTTSFAGIYSALGINIARTVFNMQNNSPDLIATHSVPFQIRL